MNKDNMKRYVTVFKQTKETNVTLGYIGTLWMLTDFAEALDGSERFVLTEYNEGYSPVTGIFSCVVTPTELDEYFCFEKVHNSR